MIPRILLESTSLRSVGYHPQLFILELEYRGRYYRDLRHYRDVPFWVPLELMASSSKGAYYNSRIRGQFPARLVRPEEHLFGTPPYGEGGELWPWASPRRQRPSQAELWGFRQPEPSLWEACVARLAATQRVWGEELLRSVTESVTPDG